MQREAAEQAEENWESLDAAEKRIFEDIAKGEPPPFLLHASFLHPLDCRFSASRHGL